MPDDSLNCYSYSTLGLLRKWHQWVCFSNNISCCPLTKKHDLFLKLSRLFPHSILSIIMFLSLKPSFLLQRRPGYWFSIHSVANSQLVCSTANWKLSEKVCFKCFFRLILFNLILNLFSVIYLLISLFPFLAIFIPLLFITDDLLTRLVILNMSTGCKNIHGTERCQWCESLRLSCRQKVEVWFSSRQTD